MKSVIFDQVSKRFTLRRERPRSYQELFLDLLRLKRPAPREEYWALREVSLQIEQGEMVGIIGPNGAGKSTLLKLIARILEPTSGTVQVNGQVGALLELGAGFHPELTGRENVYLNGSILGFSKAKMDRIFDQVVAFSEIERFIDVPVKHYSSGMYMRLAFSIAIHIEPDILLVDEVLAVGDQAFQRRCLDKIHEMKRQGVTIVLVTHALDTVRELCHRAIWLDEGQIQAEGPVDRVLEQYTSYLHRVETEALQKEEAARQEGAAEKARKRREEETAPAGPEATPWRWGSREAELVSIQFLNGEGEETRTFHTGETFIARLHYMAHQRIEQPMFGVALYHAGGFHINGPNTVFSDYPIDFIEGPGYIDYIIPQLPLLAGTYLFSAAIYDHPGQHAYDHHHMAYTFYVVANRRIKERYGFFYIPSYWRLTPLTSPNHSDGREFPCSAGQPER